MIEKQVEDYIDELSDYFPQIEKKELLRIVRSMGKLLTGYLRVGDRGFHTSSADSLVGDGKKYRFEVSRIFGKKHLYKVKNRIKYRNRLKDGKK